MSISREHRFWLALGPLLSVISILLFVALSSATTPRSAASQVLIGIGASALVSAISSIAVALGLIGTPTSKTASFRVWLLFGATPALIALGLLVYVALLSAA